MTTCQNCGTDVPLRDVCARCRSCCECYCNAPTYLEMNDGCAGCGVLDGDCYCGEN